MTPTFSIKYRAVYKVKIGSNEIIRAILCESKEAAKAITMPENGALIGVYPLICKYSDFGSMEPYHDHDYRGFCIQQFDNNPNHFHMVDVSDIDNSGVDAYHGFRNNLNDALLYIDEYRSTNICDDPGREYRYYIYSNGYDARFRYRRYLAWQHPAWNESGYFWTGDFNDFRECLPNNTDEHPFLFDDPKNAIELIKELKINFAYNIVVWDVSNEEIPEPTGKIKEFFLPGIAVEVGI